MELHEYQGSRPFFDLGQRALRFQYENLYFLETVGSVETNFHMKANHSTGMKIYTNGLGHMI